MDTASIILFSGGYSHPFDESSAALEKIANAAGYDVAIERDLNAALAGLETADLLMVNALYWSMTQHDKYAADRHEWAFEMTDAQMLSIQNFVDNGGSLFAVHTATICFDTQPGWCALLGGGWTWGKSWHPPYGKVRVSPTTDLIQLDHDAQAFDLMDECYHNLDPSDQATILAYAEQENGPQPVVWVRRQGKGRVGVNALGHDVRSLEQADHAALNQAIIKHLVAKGD